MNWWLWLITALIPIAVGALYYSPLLFANPWMKENNFTEESLKGGNMLLIMGLSYIGGIMISMVMTPVVIHQMHMFSVLMSDPSFETEGSEIRNYFDAFNAQYGTSFRTFKHGMFHGSLTGLLLVAPIIMINGLFERRGWKYMAIHAGYWVISLALIGGVICQFMKMA
jgi:hypothetical protein